MAANVYLREFNAQDAWVRLAEKRLICRVTLVVMLTGAMAPRESPQLRFNGGEPIRVPHNVPITFDGVDLYDFELRLTDDYVRLLVFAQSR